MLHLVPELFGQELCSNPFPGIHPQSSSLNRFAGPVLGTIGDINNLVRPKLSLGLPRAAPMSGFELITAG